MTLDLIIQNKLENAVFNVKSKPLLAGFAQWLSPIVTLKQFVARVLAVHARLNSTEKAADAQLAELILSFWNGGITVFTEDSAFMKHPAVLGNLIAITSGCVHMCLKCRNLEWLGNLHSCMASPHAHPTQGASDVGNFI